MISLEDYRYLLATLGSLEYSCTTIFNGRTKIYIRGLLIVEINEAGEVYNPVCKPCHLTMLFDWLNRISYNKERIVERTSLFKEELMVRCYQIFSESL